MCSSKVLPIISNYNTYIYLLTALNTSWSQDHLPYKSAQISFPLSLEAFQLGEIVSPYCQGFSNLGSTLSSIGIDYQIICPYSEDYL